MKSLEEVENSTQNWINKIKAALEENDVDFIVKNNVIEANLANYFGVDIIVLENKIVCVDNTENTAEVYKSVTELIADILSSLE